MDPMITEQPECWTRWLRESRGTNCPIEKFNHRDRRFRYTIVHAALASNNFTLCKKYLSCVIENGCAKELFPAKDKEGDTPIHSAIRSHVNPCNITTFLEAAELVDPSLKEVVLTSVNNKGECALKFACTLHDWSIVEVLLRECISCGVLSELTGIGHNQRSSCKTLLRKAMKYGDLDYLKVYLRVCKDQLSLSTDEILAGMLIPDQKNRTPWFYFLAIELHKIKEGVDLLENYGISLNKLHCEVNEAGEVKAFMLHEATRQEKEDIVALLCDHGVATDKKDGNGLIAKQRSRRIMPSFDTPRQGGTSRTAVAPGGVKRKLNLEIVKEQADTHSEAGQSSECATDVSHSPDVQPSPQCPAPPPTAWQSTEVPDDQTENDDSNRDASSMCTELDNKAPLFFIRDQLYLSTAADNHYLYRHNGLEFPSSRQFIKSNLYDSSRDSECDLLLEFNSSILGELHEGLQFITDQVDSSPAQIFLPGVIPRRLPDLRPVRRLDHLQLELNSSTTVPFLGQVHYDQISPRYTDHENCPLSDASSYMPTNYIWSNTKFNHSFPT